MRMDYARSLPNLFTRISSDKLTTAASGVLAIRILERILTFAVMVGLARLAGPHEYGYFVFWQAWLRVMSLFGRFGSDTLILRYVSEYKATKQWGRLRGLLNQSNRLAFGLSILIGLACFLVVRHLDAKSQILALVTCISVPLVVLSSLREAAIRALGHPILGQLPEFFLRPLILCVCIVALYFGCEQVTAAHELTCCLISVVATYFVGAALLRSQMPEQVQQHSPIYETRKWSQVAGAMLFISGMNLLLRQTDVLMLGTLSDPSMVGIYGNASRISDLAVFGLTAATSVMAPMIAAAYARRDFPELQRILRATSVWVLLSTTVLSLALCLVGRHLLAIFGEEFTIGFPALLILLVSQVVNAICGPVGYTMTMTGNQKTAATVIGGAAVLNVLLNYVLIPKFGLEGAAVATAISGIGWNTVLAVLVWKRLGLKTIALL